MTSLTWPPPKGSSKASQAPKAPKAPAVQKAPSILDVIRNKELFAPWFKRPETWRPWFSFLRALFALPMDADDLALFRECTGREAAPSAPSLEAVLIVGRRGGKSFVLAIIAVYLAIFRDWSQYLVPGERAVILIIATDRRQAKVIFKYCKALLTKVPALKPMVLREGDDALELTNGLSVEVQTASYRSIRGMTVCACLADEVAFWRTEEDSANPDREILDAVRPAMATVPGAMLLIASSPYARRGALYDAWRRYYGREDAPVLVWKAATRTMNPSLREDIVAEAYERDASSAAAEYGAEFRSDLEAFVSQDVINSVTVAGRYEVPPLPHGLAYSAFIDPAGGSGGDSFCLAIAHFDAKSGRAVLDAVRETKPPFSPESVVATYADLLKSYRIHKVIGDHWGGEFVREPFRKRGITYELSEQPKSDIYRDTLPLFNSGLVELLDLPRLANQFIGLERRTSRSGKDSIDHAPGGKDDLCNAAAGALLAASSRKGSWVTAALVEASARPASHFQTISGSAGQPGQRWTQ